MKNIFFYFLPLLLFSCQNNDNKSIFVSLKASGELINSSYDFCGFVLVENKYTYRKGVWTFLVNDSIKIAEGPYINKLITVDDMGGCPFSYFKDSVDIDKWSFWNINGQNILPNKRLEIIIKSKDTLWPMIDLND